MSPIECLERYANLTPEQRVSVDRAVESAERIAAEAGVEFHVIPPPRGA